MPLLLERSLNTALLQLTWEVPDHFACQRLRENIQERTLVHLLWFYFSLGFCCIPLLQSTYQLSPPALHFYIQLSLISHWQSPELDPDENKKYFWHVLAKKNPKPDYFSKKSSNWSCYISAMQFWWEEEGNTKYWLVCLLSSGPLCPWA